MNNNLSIPGVEMQGVSLYRYSNFCTVKNMTFPIYAVSVFFRIGTELQLENRYGAGCIFHVSS